jgi:hypothetical protein
VEKIIKHAVEPPTPVGALRRDLPLGVVRIVERMMAKDPGHRFQTPHEVAEALAPWAIASGHSSTLTRRTGIRPLARPPVSSLLERRLRWSATLLTMTGYVDALTGFIMLFIPSSVFPFLGPLVMVVATLILIGAMKMKSRQSYRWALCAAYLAVIPANFCFLFTPFFGIRALSCLSDAEVRRVFPPS